MVDVSAKAAHGPFGPGACVCAHEAAKSWTNLPKNPKGNPLEVARIAGYRRREADVRT